MALHRKIDALMALRPDLAVTSETAEPGWLLDRAPALAAASLVWVGRNPHKGRLLAGFGTTRFEFSPHRHDGRLHWMVPATVSGLPDLDQPVHLLGVWAQNGSEGNRQKDNPGFLQRAPFGVTVAFCVRPRPSSRVTSTIMCSGTGPDGG